MISRRYLRRNLSAGMQEGKKIPMTRAQGNEVTDCKVKGIGKGQQQQTGHPVAAVHIWKLLYRNMDPEPLLPCLPPNMNFKVKRLGLPNQAGEARASSGLSWAPASSRSRSRQDEHGPWKRTEAQPAPRLCGTDRSLNLSGLLSPHLE